MNPRFASTALTVLAAVVAPSPAISIQIAPHVVEPIAEEVDYKATGDIQIAPHVYEPITEEVEQNPYDVDTIQIEPHIYATHPPERPIYSDDSCFEDLTYFSSEVIVDFDGYGTDAEDLTEIRYDVLEKIFRQAYNYLSEDLCDQTFRHIVDVSTLPQPDGEMIILRGGNQYGIKFAIEAVCKGCDPDTTSLFSPPAQEFFRKLMSSDGKAVQGIEESPLDQILQTRRLKSTKSSKNSQSSPRNGYTCDCTSTDPAYRAPTEEEFALVFNAGIKLSEDTNSERRLETGVKVESVDRVTEIQSVICAADTETITSLVALEFFGTFADITDQERTMIEENYVFAYNGLQDLRCDSPAFRKMTSAEIFFVVDPDTNDEDTFVYLMKVEGSCRGEGCSDGGNALFFSDGGTSTQRNLQMNNETLEFVDGLECTCPTWGTEFGPPSIKEMEMRYFEVIQDLRLRELMSSIDASGYVQEIGQDGVGSETDEPTAAPQSEVTLPPFTLPPTGAPSSTPNASPVETTASPTSTPTGAPDGTASPTGVPTSAPTATPTASPTRPITPSPTRPETAAPTTPVVPTDAPTATPVAPTVPTEPPTATPTAPSDASAVPSASPQLPGATPTVAPTAEETTAETTSGSSTSSSEA